MMMAFDTETYEKKGNEYVPVLNCQKYVLGAVVDEKLKVKFFKTPMEAKKFFLDKLEYCKKFKKKLYVVMHNASYDYISMMGLDLFGKKLGVKVERPFIAIWEERIYFIDSISFFPMALSEVGKLIGKPKMELPNKIRHVDELKTYLRNDCEIVMEGMQYMKKILKKLGFSPRRYLSAGQLAITSFMTFSRRNGRLKNFQYYDEEVKYMKLYKSKYINHVRLALRGGLTKAFKLGSHNNVSYYDINSSYPNELCKMPLADLMTEKYIEDLYYDEIKHLVGVAYVKIKCSSKEFLMFRSGERNKYPINSIVESAWTILELNEAVEKYGYEIIECKWAVVYHKSSVKLFNPYIEKLYELKKNAEGTEKGIIKLLLNNLYAKFSQYRKNKEIRICHRKDVGDFILKGYEIKNVLNENYIVVRESEPYTPSYIAPIWTVYCTALARVKLWRKIYEVGYDNVIYCDTDSIMVNSKVSDSHFKLSDKIGEWKKVDYGNCKILGCKKVLFNNSNTIVAVPKFVRNKINENGESIGNWALKTETPIEFQKMVTIGDGLARFGVENIGTFRTESIDVKMDCPNDYKWFNETSYEIIPKCEDRMKLIFKSMEMRGLKK